MKATLFETIKNQINEKIEAAVIACNNCKS